MKYPAILEPTETGYSIYFPDLPGCTSTAHDVPDATSMAREAALAWLEFCSGDGESWPEASETVEVHRDDLILWVEVGEQRARAA